ncbi:Hypothetical protein HDN1F_24930 [gamma proteobacterium HdN1]|nr:Hypothetical protein HDN1F_24930 [gamma proteobacterium HdN1]
MPTPFTHHHAEQKIRNQPFDPPRVIATRNDPPNASPPTKAVNQLKKQASIFFTHNNRALSRKPPFR